MVFEESALTDNQVGAMRGEAARKVHSLDGRIALVTGASSGIGRAIAIALSREGARVCGVARNPAALAETVAAAQKYSRVTGFQTDLTSEEELKTLVVGMEEIGRLDIIVHCAGIMHQGLMEHAPIQDLDIQYSTNVRAPYLLTQRLLPLLTAACGQIVFVNSSVGLAAKRADLGQYAATKHALKALAESLREEVNPKGVRVLSVFLGRTATPMQEAVFRAEGIAYCPERLLQPEDVASVVVHALMLPQTAEVTDISLRPTRRSY
jgi:NAD(P)-dependent dehydrogenase (short-subunit alcohol dehydrogenase family)